MYDAPAINSYQFAFADNDFRGDKMAEWPVRSMWRLQTCWIHLMIKRVNEDDDYT